MLNAEFLITDKTTLGEILRVARQRKELKVYELAKLAQVNPVYITQIEKDYKLPSPETFLKILDLLDVDFNTFWECQERFMKGKFPDFEKTQDLLLDYSSKKYPALKKKITKTKALKKS